jgi:hypothetical protein
MQRAAPPRVNLVAIGSDSKEGSYDQIPTTAPLSSTARWV